jgi:hypothetical protein
MRLLMPGVVRFHLEGSTQSHELLHYNAKLRIEAKPTLLPPPLTLQVQRIFSPYSLKGQPTP